MSNQTSFTTSFIKTKLHHKDTSTTDITPPPLTESKKQLLQTIKNRFAGIPKGVSLAEELIAERRIEVTKIEE